jgi:hypothetical protein
MCADRGADGAAGGRAYGCRAAATGRSTDAKTKYRAKRGGTERPIVRDLRAAGDLIGRIVLTTGLLLSEDLKGLVGRRHDPNHGPVGVVAQPAVRRTAPSTAKDLRLRMVSLHSGLAGFCRRRRRGLRVRALAFR